ncbi:hypothetical protein ACD591_14305 [Rufibacter glacialis]|uniref:Uncharacterized protein n=1 Tax=Rufibacter glacialis TaxID=1259555 RepID=A0A5M8Q537_9BACT|nr:hypothetical protein [Rufibacter glacialis]KAA6430985.1 hypothetical protein FOE74_17925 [Rufibacter glacialis]GGK83078.1 hypothetical protein GCM10011405_33620 [Rufibacter glacialis]
MIKKLYFLVFFCWVAVECAWSQNVTSGQPFFIELHNGERVYAQRLQFKSPVFKQNFFLLDDTLRYAPEAVKYFQSQDGYYARVDAGRRFSNFAQREQAGRISTYYVYRTEYNSYSPGIGIGMGGYGMGGYGMGGYGYPTQRRVYYFEKEKGPLQPLTYKNLRVALSDNPGSMESLHDYKKGQNIQTGMYVAGAGLMVAGVAQQFRSGYSGSSVSPLLLVGAGISLLPQLFRLVKKDKLSEAIELYNYTPQN